MHDEIDDEVLTELLKVDHVIVYDYHDDLLKMFDDINDDDERDDEVDEHDEIDDIELIEVAVIDLDYDYEVNEYIAISHENDVIIHDEVIDIHHIIHDNM